MVLFSVSSINDTQLEYNFSKTTTTNTHIKATGSFEFYVIWI